MERLPIRVWIVWHTSRAFRVLPTHLPPTITLHVLHAHPPLHHVYLDTWLCLCLCRPPNPNRWSGNPCAQLWGGESHYYVGNECILGGEAGSYPDPVGLDGTREGAACRVDLQNASNARLVAHLGANTYWTQDGTYSAPLHRTLIAPATASLRSSS